MCWMNSYIYFYAWIRSIIRPCRSGNVLHCNLIFSNSGSHQCWNVHAVAALLMRSIDSIYSGFCPRETKCLLNVRNTRAVMTAHLLLCHNKKNKNIHGCPPTGVRSSPMVSFCRTVTLSNTPHTPLGLSRDRETDERSAVILSACWSLKLAWVTVFLGKTAEASCAENGLVWPRRGSLKEKLLEYFCYISLFIMPERRTFIILQGSARAM